MATIDRSDASATIPEESVNEIIKSAVANSAVLSLPNVRRTTASRNQVRVPVVSLLPDAYWVEEGGTKTEGAMAWQNKFVEIRELAVIIRFHDNVLADSAFNLTAEAIPIVGEAIGQKIDQAVMFGIDAPAAFPESISEGCDRTDNEVEVDDDSTTKDYAAYVNDAFGKVEEDGFAVNGAVGRLGVKAKLRGLRDDHGQPIYSTSLQNDGRVSSIYGENLAFSANGSWDASEADMIVGDWSKLLYVMRQDITVLESKHATIGGQSVFERDETAYRFTCRCGFLVLNPPNRENPDDDTRYPFAAVRPDGWTGSAGTVS